MEWFSQVMDLREPVSVNTSGYKCIRAAVEVPCQDGLLRAGDQKLHISFAVFCTDFKNVH